MRSHRVFCGAMVWVGVLAMGAGAYGQDMPEPVLTDRPDRQEIAPQDDRGVPFESALAGISMRFPSGGSISQRAGSDEVVRYVNEKRNWVISVHRVELSRPLHVSKPRDPSGRNSPGMLELRLEEFLTTNAGARVLRQDLVNIRDANVGMLVMRYTIGTSRRLTQEAIIEVDPKLYFILTFTSPGAPKAQEDEEFPAETQAIDAFARILDSVKLHDRAALRKEQEERLFATRAFYANLRERQLRGALIPEQWMRLIRDGKDIGYTYVVEELGNESDIRAGQRAEGRGPEKGVLIGVRSRSIPEPGRQVDAESWLYCAFDRKHESWSNLLVMGKPEDKKKDYAIEFGSSDQRTRAITDPSDPTGRRMTQIDVYDLNVSYLTRSGSVPPVERALSPWYLPQAVSHLLPRLLPLRPSKKFMFAVYVGSEREVMHRYVEVQEEREADINGRRMRAIPISDRVGYESDPTIHYMSPDGKYLGSHSPVAGIWIIPTDAATLHKIWSDPNLTRPGKTTEGEAPQGVD